MARICGWRTGYNTVRVRCSRTSDVRGADVPVAHLAIPAGGTSPLHASPAVVGRVARDARVGRLVLSHIGQFDLDAAIADVKKSYTGPVTVGVDLQCTPVP
jgi:ribonuclease BN (tRNA processing enzyme)